jgi:hypothetical protein
MLYLIDMLIIKTKQRNSLVVTVSQNSTIPNPEWLFSFTHIFSKQQVRFIPTDISVSRSRYDEFEFIEGTGVGEIAFPFEGQYNYSIWQQPAGSGNLNPSLSDGAVEYGTAVVLVSSADTTNDYYIEFISDNEFNSNYIFAPNELNPPTPTGTQILTPTPTPSITASPTVTPSQTPTQTPTGTLGATPTPTGTGTPTPTGTGTPTPTPSPTQTGTGTPTPTPTTTLTATPTGTGTPTPTPTTTLTATPTGTGTPTPTPTTTLTATPTGTGTPTPTPTTTLTATPTGTGTPTPTPTTTLTSTPTGTGTPTPTPTTTLTQSPTASPVPFDPSQITELRTWYDANDATTITKRTGTDFIEVWADKSGNNYNLTQSTASAQPLFTGGTSVASWSANTYVYFDGNDYIARTTGTSFSDSGFTYFFVAKIQNTEADGLTFNYTDQAPPVNIGKYRAYQSQVASERTLDLGADNNRMRWIWTPPATLGGKNEYQYGFVSGTTAGAFSGSVNDLIYNSSQNIGSIPSTIAAISIGANNNGDAPTVGYVAEIIVYGKVLTTTEKNNVETYLKNKWRYNTW